MALLSVIRRWHFREHLSIREIGRRTGLSRNTVRKYLRLGSVEPQFNVLERSSKLDPFADRLAAWLRTEAKKNRKQKRTMKQLHADLVSLGYDGAYGRVADHAGLHWCLRRPASCRNARTFELRSGRGLFLQGAFWALSSSTLGTAQVAIGIAMINATSNLIGGSLMVNLYGSVLESTGSHGLALLPVAVVAMTGALLVLKMNSSWKLSLQRARHA